jgi:uncharacterized protein YcbX
MFVKEIWRYAVKSMAGERMLHAVVGELGITGDRIILVNIGGRVVTSRTHHQLLGLKGTLDSNGVPQISGHTAPINRRPDEIRIFSRASRSRK